MVSVTRPLGLWEPQWQGPETSRGPGTAGTQAFLVIQCPPLPPFPAASKRDCLERFGPQTLERITRDDAAICTTEYSRIVPLENGEVGRGGAVLSGAGEGRGGPGRGSAEQGLGPRWPHRILPTDRGVPGERTSGRHEFLLLAAAT